MLHFDAKILLVDDDESVRKSTKRLLRAIGFNKVTAVSDGKDAVELLVTEQFDCIISDWEMPIVNGLDLLQMAQGDVQAKHIPFILMSGRMDSQLKSRALTLGASNCLDKSTLGIDELTAVLGKISDR